MTTTITADAAQLFDIHSDLLDLMTRHSLAYKALHIDRNDDGLYLVKVDVDTHDQLNAWAAAFYQDGTPLPEHVRWALGEVADTPVGVERTP